ncbi:MAG: protein kinase, partial [Planctomycetes bacterium]|nr:protein kinase [Planctomycetota bacterium]
MTRVPADRDEEPENSGESKIPTRFLSGEEATQLEHDGRSHAPPGISRIGPFQIERELGRGGMGAVYLARDPGLGREVALKVISAAEFASSTDRKRFRREAEVAAGIQHPHVVRVYQSGEEGGLLYFTMDYVEGRSL